MLFSIVSFRYRNTQTECDKVTYKLPVSVVCVFSVVFRCLVFYVCLLFIVMCALDMLLIKATYLFTYLMIIIIIICAYLRIDKVGKANMMNNICGLLEYSGF